MSHERIYLEKDNPTHDATWSQCRINDDDIEYVRADLLEAAQAEARELKRRIDILLCPSCLERCDRPPTGLFHSHEPEEEPCLTCWIDHDTKALVDHSDRAEKAEAEARELRDELSAWLELHAAATVGIPDLWPNEWPQDVATVAFVIHQLRAKLARVREALEESHARHRCGCGHPACRQCGRDRRAKEALSQPAEHPHSDDAAVDQFAQAMKSKMAAARAKGRSGWDDPAQCNVEYLAEQLIEHLPKGDPIDVANFAMMLWHRQGGEVMAETAQREGS